MRPDARRTFGRTGLEVTAFGFGTAPIGNFLREIDEETSAAMIDRAWEAGVRFFDAAPMYGHGLAELRHANTQQPDGHVLLAATLDQLSQFVDARRLGKVRGFTTQAKPSVRRQRFAFAQDVFKPSLERHRGSLPHQEMAGCTGS